MLSIEPPSRTEAVPTATGPAPDRNAAAAEAGVIVPPPDALHVDCGNSGTTARLLLGLLSGWLLPADAPVILSGDTSLSCRPMARVVDPLRSMGADLQWTEQPGRLPVCVRGARLTAIDYRLPVPSAQVKSALLLAGLFARGRTRISGGGRSRDHTERMLRMMGVTVAGGEDPELAGLEERAVPVALDLQVPGDPSAAAFLQVAAALVPGSRLTVTGQSLNPGRTAALDVFQRCGLDVTITATAGAATDQHTEPSGDVTVAAGPIGPFQIGEDEVPGLVDELPVLAVLATQAQGVSLVTGAGELRFKESDRIAVMARGLRALGARIDELPDGWRITGPTTLNGGTDTAPLLLKTAGDHRVAMALAVAALIADGQSQLDDDGCVAISFPDFFDRLGELAGT